MSLTHLPGTRLTPEVLLHTALDNCQAIKAVAIVVIMDDDTLECDWSQMTVAELCMAAKMLDIAMIEVLNKPKR